MKGVTLYLAGGVITVLLVALAYLFSFPAAMWATAKFLPGYPTRQVVQFYAPALMLAGNCPPYRAILDYENKLLGGGPVFINARRGQVKKD